MRRAAIYFFFDEHGVADDYIDYFLRDFCDNVDRLVVVVNGKLTPESRQLFERHTKEIIVRPNIGLDVYAYKTGLDYIGWDNLLSYDEVVLLNFTMMGPIYPLAEAFAAMATRDLDFWGLTRYGRVEDPWGTNPYGYIPEHIQSHFTVYRKRFVQSSDLQSYWQHLPEIQTYGDAIGKHESYFTKFFADQGYAWAAYVDPAAEDWTNPNLLIFAPTLLLDRYRCPIFKRRSFFQPKDSLMNESAGEAARDLLHYLNTETPFDTGLVWRNILRTCEAADIVDALGLFFVLPDGITAPSFSRAVGPQASAAATTRSRVNPRDAVNPADIGLRVVLVMHLFFMDLLPDSVAIAANMPSNADIIVTTCDDERVALVESAFAALPQKVRVVKVTNRGRDVSALIIGAAPFLSGYDVACFYHDKKSAQNDPATIGISFARRTADNTLGTPEFVRQVVSLFAREPYLGLLTPPEPNHGVYYLTLGSAWTVNYPRTKAVAGRLGLKVPMSPKKDPVGPLGTVFWFRPRALQTLFDGGFTYDEFPEEGAKAAIDGGLMHAIERTYSLAAQAAGYYSAFVLAEAYAGLELVNLRHYVRSLNRAAFTHDIGGTGYETALRLNARLDWARSIDLLPSRSLPFRAARFGKRKLKAAWRPARIWLRARLVKVSALASQRSRHA